MVLFAHTPIKYSSGGISYLLPTDSIIIFDTTQIREYSADGGILVCDWLCFESENDEEFIEALPLEYGRPVRFADNEFIGDLMRNLTETFYSVSPRRLKLIDTYLKLLLVKLAEPSELLIDNFQQSADPHFSALADLRAKIYRNPQLKWNVDTMAADVNMSRSYFQHVYREVFGVSCISDVISGKIEKAKEILSETDCTVSQVAAMCGYDNEEHFMRQFKKIVGVTPTRYRKGL